MPAGEEGTMEFLVLPLIIGIIAVPAPGPSSDALADFTRIQKALNREVYVRDTAGQERIVSILDAGTDAITVAIGQQQMTLQRDEILAVDRMKDSSRDGFVKGALIGLILGAAVGSAFDGRQGQYMFRAALSYGAIGYLFDYGHTSRAPLYRAP
jgi:hypothetical protein